MKTICSRESFLPEFQLSGLTAFFFFYISVFTECIFYTETWCQIEDFVWNGLFVNFFFLLIRALQVSCREMGCLWRFCNLPYEHIYLIGLHIFFFCVHHLYSLVVIAIVLACGTLSSSKTVLVVFAWLCDCCQGYIEPHFASIFSCKVWDKTFQDISKLLFDNTLMERKCIISMDLTNYFVYGKPSNIFLYNSPFEGGGGSKIDMVRSRGIFKNEYFETPCDCMLCLSTSALLSHLNSLNYKLHVKQLLLIRKFKQVHLSSFQ